jgi:hypothetical protein
MGVSQSASCSIFSLPLYEEDQEGFISTRRYEISVQAM